MANPSEGSTQVALVVVDGNQLSLYEAAGASNSTPLMSASGSSNPNEAGYTTGTLGRVLEIISR
jgi:hypothetical protein